MEKRHQNTLARTLESAAACAKIGLISILFVPVFFAAKYVAPEAAEPGSSPALEHMGVSWPKILARIRSIVKSQRPDISDKEANKLSTAILDESAKRNLDPMLVLAVIKVESGFRNQAVSPVGARGIMQIMPETGKFLSEELLRRDGMTQTFTPAHLDDPEINIKLGVYYLDGLKKQFRNLNLALLAYNLGPGEVQNRLDNDIYFSDDYAAVVLDAYREYKNSKTAAF